MICTIKPDYIECQYCLREQAETGIILCEKCKWYNEVYEILWMTDDYAMIYNDVSEGVVSVDRIQIKGEEKKYEN